MKMDDQKENNGNDPYSSTKDQMIEKPRQLASHTINYDPVDIKDESHVWMCWSNMWQDPLPILVQHISSDLPIPSSGPYRQSTGAKEQKFSPFYHHNHFLVGVFFLLTNMIHLQMDDKIRCYLVVKPQMELSIFGGLKNNWRVGLLFEGSTATAKWPGGNHFPRMQCRLITHQCHLSTIQARMVRY